jgi:hypothetical protein
VLLVTFCCAPSSFVIGMLRLPRLSGMELRLLSGMLLRDSNSPASRCSLQATAARQSSIP